METVAVYAEHPIKTYGVKAEEGYALIKAFCTPQKLQACLAKLNPGPGLGRVFWVGTSRRDGRWMLSALMLAQGLDELSGGFKDCGLTLNGKPRSAALIHLQGPHFGDRYGIFAAAMQGLKAAGVTPLLMDACVHSLIIAVEPLDSTSAIRGLKQYFCAPE